MDINDHGESDDTNGDGEGVWSPDIEQCFREALLLFPPCGRRKHILQEEGGGKMYGRNELIARHIMMRTGKRRTRKQVSSHIQVLARRKAKAEASSSTTGMSPVPGSGPPRSQAGNGGQQDNMGLPQQVGYQDVWMDRPIANQKIRLVEFSAFIEYRNIQQPRCMGNSNPLQQPMITSMVTTPHPLPIMGSETPDLGSPLLGPGNPHLSIQQHQQQPTFGATSNHQHPQQQQHQAVTHPLASNHHLPAQFNQASYPQAASAQNNNNNNTIMNNNQLQPHNPQHSHQKGHYTVQGQGNQCITSCNPQHLVTQPQPSAGSTRHSYVQIDYRQTQGRQTNKLEMIPLKEIHDKFPEIGGSEGLFQRWPSDAFFVVKFWADLNNDYEYNIDDQNSYFGFSSHFETIDPYKDITCSTKACSYGLQVVEKVEKIYGAFNSSNGRYSYDINRSPMCDFMVHFIKKLRQLPEATQMDSVLENFTVLQVITSESTSEILLCLAYLFETAKPDQNNGPHYHVYKLTKD